MTSTPQFIPQTEPTGGTAVGNSYLTTFAACPRDWFNLFCRPVQDEAGQPLGVGIRTTTTGIPLLVGSICHDGLEGWYRSGIRDGEDTGERSIDAALAAVDQSHQTRYREFQGAEEADQVLDVSRHLMRAYHDRYGPESSGSEYPTWKVLCDAQGEPLVEREWCAQLTPGYVYTCRTDLIGTHHGLLKTMEHKFTTPSGVRARLREMDMDPQFTSEYWILREMFPDLTLNGVLVSMTVRDKATGPMPLGHNTRETTIRSQGQLNRWKSSALSILQQIDESVGLYQSLIADGWEPEPASEQAFPDHGTRTGRCYAYFSQCQFLPLCQAAGIERRAMANYTVRFPNDVEQAKAAGVEGDA